jgi:hypothetical protein
MSKKNNFLGYPSYKKLRHRNKKLEVLIVDRKKFAHKEKIPGQVPKALPSQQKYIFDIKKATTHFPIKFS